MIVCHIGKIRNKIKDYIWYLNQQTILYMTKYINTKLIENNLKNKKFSIFYKISQMDYIV